MRSFATLILAFVTLLGFTTIVHAERCSKEFGACADNTPPTPCCGNGKCNIFCSNCDNGCRAETYDGCIGTAERKYGPKSDCIYCWHPKVIYPGDCPGPQGCEDHYSDTIAACKVKYGVFRRRLARSGVWRPQRVNPSDPADGYEVFALVDTDHNGNITLDEYVDYIQSMHPSLKAEPHLLLEWLKYFESFDRNGDGVIHIDEHHRVVDD
ncbi:hypothetical protein DE146DRAFT_783161 [Phaeosphaeria sp. MPI-PUGE-AT-0046c]|nr:hypothetical protein DE146DRAFT_783161 [Phaeosphaeria sp. MPI-PUGE-AT-0046c]